MALAISNSLITIQSGAGAVQSPANGATVLVDQGRRILVALASTSGIARWTLQFIAPAYPSLHQLAVDWAPGQNNGFEFFLPAEGVTGDHGAQAGIQIVSTVSDGSGGGVPSSTYLLQTKSGGSAAVPMQVNADYVIVAALPTYTNTNGVLAGNSNGAITSAMADAATPAVGDTFLLEQGLAAAAADAGLYQITAVGAAGAKFGAVRMNFGQLMMPKSEILVGSRGTVFKNTTWVNTLAGLSNVIGTASFTYFPRFVTWTSACVAGVNTAGASATSGAPAVMAVQSATLSNLVQQRLTANTCTLTTGGYQINGLTAGGLGTGSASGFATVAAGTINNVDVSTMIMTLVNPC